MPSASTSRPMTTSPPETQWITPAGRPPRPPAGVIHPPADGDTFGTYLAALRARARQTQSAVGFAAGYHPSYVSRLERGDREPTVDVVARLADTVTGVHPAERHDLFRLAGFHNVAGDPPIAVRVAAAIVSLPPAIAADVTVAIRMILDGAATRASTEGQP